MSNYPGGTSASDPRAPWNQSPAPECRSCEEMITREKDHKSECSNKGMGPEELYAQREENAKIEKAEHKREQQRIERALDDE